MTTYRGPQAGLESSSPRLLIPPHTATGVDGAQQPTHKWNCPASAVASGASAGVRRAGQRVSSRGYVSWGALQGLGKCSAYYPKPMRRLHPQSYVLTHSKHKAQGRGQQAGKLGPGSMPHGSGSSGDQERGLRSLGNGQPEAARSPGPRHTM